jgi:hypothetical protein
MLLLRLSADSRESWSIFPWDGNNLIPIHCLEKTPHAPLSRHPAARRLKKGGGRRQATNLLLEQVAEARKTLPKDSPQLAQQLVTLSLSLLQAKAFCEIGPLLRESLAIHEKTQPDVSAVIGRSNPNGKLPRM